VSSILLFYGGIAFAYYIVFPVIFGYFASTAPAGVLMMTDINNYLDFVVLLSFAFGVAFEIPIATILLVLTGLVKIDSLAKNRGYVLIGIFVIAAFLTPPDAISQVTMAVPMYFLYEFGILMSRVLLKARLRRAAEDEAQEKQAGA
jgi:sec-independent protein translocase protein TatC